ncbi:XdhC family protein [Consotaella salsifontis]|uniref:Xanthine dehydrogenase accessory factor n=1 Tax=Consotaella salsifontis TaxID=1365950 RepID=A0A1T4L4K2_9HYPH|nr:XdhC family protein [Consotaella salsifontis]SJZ49563.1 xanthine dehydrogenase accessory factor [Consotaella salsifontis]
MSEPQTLSPRLDALRTAAEWAEQRRSLALATVIETWGSAPRPAGSHLVIDAEGSFEGSVSGGCVEGAVVTEALDVIASGEPRLLEFGVADETAWRVGLSCGGRIRVHVGAVGEGDDALLAALNHERAARRAAALVTDLATGARRLVKEAEVAGDGLAGPIAESLRTGKSKLVESGSESLFVNPYLPSPRLVLIGAVHISQALAPMAAIAGLDVEIIDPRTAFASPERFPGVVVHADWPDAVLEQRPLDSYTALAALTHDPKIDDAPLMAALSVGCFYVGALGSRKTHGRRIERLGVAGIAENLLARIDAPIGLDIGAANPPEIAVAVLAGVISALRGRALRDSAASTARSA